LNGSLNYGILCGEINDLIVIDLDVKNNNNSIEWFESVFKVSPENIDTLCTRTPSGGYHVFFKYDYQIPRKINHKDPDVDILSNGAYSAQGKGYEIICNLPIKTLTQSELEKILALNVKETKKEQKNTKSKINNPNTKRQTNRVLGIPEDTNWEVKVVSNGTQFIPDCMECLLNPDKQHSTCGHSSMFVNNDGNVVTTCFSDGSKVLDSKEAKQIIKIILENKADNVFEQLIDDILEIGQIQNLRREPETGTVYKPIKPYAYVKHEKSRPNDFLNMIFYGDKKFISNVNNMDNLVKCMKQVDSPDFPFIQRNKKYIGFCY
jgi:hypothetical protein